MPFTLPVFNLRANFWTALHTPAVDPPDVLDVGCQLYVSSRAFLDISPGSPDLWVPPIFIRLPLGSYLPVRLDIAEVVPGSLDYYKVRWVQSIHRGFVNEYIASLVEQCDANGICPRP